MKKPMDSKRSDKWPALRKAFLKGKVCAVCGGTKKLEAHHLAPFHLFPEKELDVTNLLPLCEGNKEINCHLFFGHYGNFKSYNPTATQDSENWFKDRENAKNALKSAKK